MRLWIITFLAAAFMFSSCNKDEDDKLEGKWQLRQVETEGQIVKVDTVFYNFQTSLFMFQIARPSSNGMRHRYGFKDLEGENTLVLELDESDPNNPLSNFLPHTDWDSAKEVFTIEKLTGSQLILNRNNKRYIFRKF